MKNEETLQTQTDKKKPSHRIYIITAVIILLCVVAGFAYRAATWSPENSESQKASEDKIRSAAFRFPENEPDNPDDEFANVTKLILGENNYSSESFVTELSDIKLLEKFTNLELLSLGRIIYPRNDIPKWMILLAKLGIFDVDRRFALDLSPIEKLQNLKMLTIRNTVVKSIKPLSSLVNLQTLELPRTSINNMEPLKNLVNLKRLIINETTVSDLKPIKKFKNLEYLDISYTQVNNLEPIKGLTNLQTLYIQNCPNITDQQVEDLQKALPNLKIER
jgi:hypothetical protein